ncbi:MAG: hypothetical protein J6L24_05905, partial [Oscillospiraceae bacterium]|nr:hypothetical protein [Oscillospiraceae bacterium]
ISMAIEFLSLDLGCGDFILTNSIAFFYSFGLTSIVTLQKLKRFSAHFRCFADKSMVQWAKIV